MKKLVPVALLMLVLAGCGAGSDHEPGENRNIDFGESCTEQGGAWTFSEGNEWDSCTIYPLDSTR